MAPASGISNNLVPNSYPYTDPLFSVDDFLIPINLYSSGWGLNYSHPTGLAPNDALLEANAGTSNSINGTTPSNSNITIKEGPSVTCKASGLAPPDSLLAQCSSPGSHRGSNSNKDRALK